MTDELLAEGYSPEQIRYAEALLMIYRSMRILQLMDESGCSEWEETSREEVRAFIDVAAQEVGLTSGDKDSDEAVWRFIEHRMGALEQMPYHEYLQSPEWKDVRRFALQSAGHRCQVCNREWRLQVHHREYTRRGHERLADVTVLCGPCHETFHRERGMPWRKK